MWYVMAVWSTENYVDYVFLRNCRVILTSYTNIQQKMLNEIRDDLSQDKFYILWIARLTAIGKLMMSTISRKQEKWANCTLETMEKHIVPFVRYNFAIHCPVYTLPRPDVRTQRNDNGKLVQPIDTIELREKRFLFSIFKSF